MPWHLHTVSTSTSTVLYLLPMLMFLWWLQKVPDIWYVAYLHRNQVCLACLPFIRIRAEQLRKPPSPTLKQLGEHAPVFLKPRLKRKLKQIFSANKPCFAVERLNW